VDPETWVPLAEVARPHGVRGEVRLKLFNKTSDTLLAMDEVLVRLPDGEEHEVSVERARRADDAILMKLYSVDDRDRAEELRGALVCVRRGDFPPAEEGEFYAVDVVGAEARLAGGARVGEVVEVLSYPSVEALLVRPDDGLGDWEIPLTEQYVGEIDAPGRVVEIVTLEGLERLPAKKRKPRARSDETEE
jgi:16S rRNA processing protein RimM